MELPLKLTPTGHVIEIDGLQALLDHADAPGTVPEHQRSSRTSTDRKFTGTSTYAQAMQLARKGWPEGRDRIAKMSGAFIHKVMSRVWQPEIQLQDEGEAIDVATLMTGEPECFLQLVDSDRVSEQPSSQQKVIKIAVNLVAPHWVTTDIIERRGCAIAALIAALEATGKSCEVVGWFALRGAHYTEPLQPNTKRLLIGTTIKQPSQPLQFDVLAFMLCHAAALRRIGFAVMETIPVAVRQQYQYMGGAQSMGGYGSVAILGATDGDLLIDNADLCSPAWTDDAKAIDWVLSQLDQQGVELLD